jgi:dienelactone hydrolase
LTHQTSRLRWESATPTFYCVPFGLIRLASETSKLGVLAKEAFPLGLAKRVVDGGFTVFLPLLFGEPNDNATVANAFRVCLSREFNCLAAHASSPITRWLRALSRRIYSENLGGKGVGAIGMCLTGGFVLSLMLEPHVMAPVASEPALPIFAFSNDAKQALGVSPAELEEASHRDIALLGLRFSGDWLCPAQRFETLQAKFGARFERIVIDSSPGNPFGIRPHAHAVLTQDYKDTPDHPTRTAFERVLAFLHSNLRP